MLPKGYLYKKNMQKVWKINSGQTLFHFLTSSCKMRKQILYDLILLNLDNTPK